MLERECRSHFIRIPNSHEFSSANFDEIRFPHRFISQAFVWWSTFGGFFGLGWLRDFFRIPSYVADSDAADEPFQPPYASPPFSWTRCLAQMYVGSQFAFMIRVVIPDDILQEYLILKVRATGGIDPRILFAYCCCLLILLLRKLLLHFWLSLKILCLCSLSILNG